MYFFSFNLMFLVEFCCVVINNFCRQVCVSQEIIKFKLQNINFKVYPIQLSYIKDAQILLYKPVHEKLKNLLTLSIPLIKLF